LKRWWKSFLLAVILVFFGIVVFNLIAVRGTLEANRPAAQAHGTAVVSGSAGHLIAGRFYITGTPASGAPMVVVLHGDAPFRNPGYQYGFASDLARAAPGTRVAALLRPGYADPFGAKSDGDRGFASGENYTKEVTGDIAAAVESLKSQWGASTVILVGHSGGAVIAANLAALNPGLVQHVFLVGCPCNVPDFRRHMARLQWDAIWLLPVRSLSPLQTLDRMQKGTEVTTISGANDPIALPEYAQAYVSKAAAHGIAASMIFVTNQGHEILNDPAVIEQVAKAVHRGF
jgi:predicted esterase